MTWHSVAIVLPRSVIWEIAISVYRGRNSQNRLASHHFLGVAGFVGKIKVRAHKPLCERLCYEVGVRNDVTIAEYTKSLGRDIRE